MTGKAPGTMIPDGTIGATQLGTNSVAADEIAAGAVGTDELAANAVATVDIQDGAVTTAKVADNAITTAKIAASARPILTVAYDSGEQTITTAGTLSLTHGLGMVPKIIRVVLICKTVEGNYAVNDEVEWGLVGDAVADRGVVLVPNATTIFVRYANNATVFGLPNKTTGTVLNLTNGNWRMIVRAWA
jgi:hypothetical protein